MPDLHSLLRRQMRKHLGGEERLPGISREFIDAVDAAYKQADEDRKLVERSLELNSRELLAANAELRGMATELEKRVAERTVELEEASAQLRSELDERRRLEQELLQAQKMEAIGRLAGGIAHDFNNLLTAILGYGDFLQNAVEGDERLSGFVLEIQNAGKRAASLTQQLLAFSRRQVIQPKALQLNEIVLGMNGMLRRLIGAHIELMTVLQPDLGSISADQSQIEQVVLNLVVNARDAMPDGGTLRVETEEERLTESRAAELGATPGRFVVLTVTDTGTGMSEETRSRLFEPFFTTKELGKGTGLGLSTVYGIVQQNHGFISVTSAPGQGTEFRISLPRASNGERKGPSVQPGPSATLAAKVLLIDGDDAVRQITARMLRAEGYTVHEASNLSEAPSVAAQAAVRFDLVLSDVMRTSASSIAELSERLGSARVLFMTGGGPLPRDAEGSLPDGSALLSKPFSRQQLLEKVREILDPGERNADAGS